MCLQARAQQQEPFVVTGKVISAASGVAIEGATITNKRTRIHAVTDRLGDYRIPARPDDILIFSFVGYVTAEEEISGREKIIVALDSAENTLEEVEINMGYYTVKDRERTGSVARITAETIEKQVITNPLSAMQGRMAGVDISQNSGIPGGSFNVTVRGASSLRSEANLPLYLIDGIPFPSNSVSGQLGMSVMVGSNPLNIISPSDIERVEVLKDADATAIYGSRGANGVILITTKKARGAMSSIGLNINHGLGVVPKYMDLLSTQQYIEMRKDAFENDNMAMTVNNAYDLLLWDTTRYTDWQEKLLGGTAHTTNMQANFSGGNESTNILVRGGYSRQDNVFPESGAYQRGNIHTDFNHRGFNNTVSIRLSVNYAVDHNTLPNDDLTVKALTLPPNAPELYNEEGKLNWGPGFWFDNPLAISRNSLTRQNTNLGSSLHIGVRLGKGMTVSLNGGVNQLQLKDIQVNPASAANPALQATSTTRFYNGNANDWILEPQFDFKSQFGKGTLTGLLGGTLQAKGIQGEQLNASGFRSEAMMHNKGAAEVLRSLDNTNSKYKYAALYSRLNFEYNGKYIVNLTGRRDGSSRFGPGRQWGTFGALGAAWLFHNEKPFHGNSFSWLSFGKLRASYGITGSDQIDNYMYLSTYAVNASLPYQITTLQPLRLANTNYGWETNKKTEAALELGAWKERVHLTVAWFSNRSSDQLIGLSLPDITGFPTVQHNFPATVGNSGWEFEFASTNLISTKIQWRTAFNFTHIKRKLVAFPDIASFPFYDNEYIVGERMDISKKYEYSRVDPLSGLYTFVDQNGDGIINADDRIWYSPRPRYYGGLNNMFSFRNLHLEFLIRYVRQEGLDHRNFFPLPGTIANQPIGVMNRWIQEGDASRIQRFSRNNSVSLPSLNQWKASDEAMIDNSFLRLQNVHLSWQMPTSLLSRLRLKNAMLYVQGQNLYILSPNSKTMDPETFSTSIPPLRTFVFGFQLTI